MPSILPGYEYDIFISYRQKDNKGDRWVSEFVDALKTEIEATFKEDISIYFDENPHDSLKETYNVDKSLEGKLRCLIFIPILSQTYCDPNSYAWKQEFQQFNQAAGGDTYGRDIRLGNGNVASRILPVKIHDLDPDDLKLYESETGGALRCIDFIYRRPGVNRPLKPDDDKKDNLNGTLYRDQVNKLAHAIKEIVNGLKKSVQPVSPDAKKEDNIHDFSMNRNSKSIAVLPFINMSSDPDNEYFSDGITEEIIHALSNIAELRVIARTSAFMFKGQNHDIREIGNKLNVGTVLEGSVRKAGQKLRITAQLIDVDNGYHLWSDCYDGTLDDIFDLQERLARKIAGSLRIRLSESESERLAARPIDDPRVYEIWLRARQEAWSFTPEGLTRAISLVRQARGIIGSNALLDSAEGLFHCLTYDMGINHNDETLRAAEDLANRALKADPELSTAHFAKGWALYKRGDFPEMFRFITKSIAIDRNSDALFMIGFSLAEAGLIAEAQPYADEALARDPLTWMSHAPRNTISLFEGRFEEAISFFEADASQLAPDDPVALWWQGQAYAFGGRTQEALALFDRVGALGMGVFSLLCQVFAAGLRDDRAEVLRICNDPDLQSTSKTDEYYPTQIAAALVLAGQNDEALIWLERAINWGFTNHVWLGRNNRFLAPLRNDTRFQELMKVARRKQDELLEKIKALI